MIPKWIKDQLASHITTNLMMLIDDRHYLLNCNPIKYSQALVLPDCMSYWDKFIHDNKDLEDRGGVGKIRRMDQESVWEFMQRKQQVLEYRLAFYHYLWEFFSRHIQITYELSEHQLERLTEFHRRQRKRYPGRVSKAVSTAWGWKSVALLVNKKFDQHRVRENAKINAWEQAQSLVCDTAWDWIEQNSLVEYAEMVGKHGYMFDPKSFKFKTLIQEILRDVVSSLNETTSQMGGEQTTFPTSTNTSFPRQVQRIF